MSNVKETKYKTVYTLRVRQQLKDFGIEPILEKDNIKKPGYKCWVYEATPAFLSAFNKVVNEGRSAYGKK